MSTLGREQSHMARRAGGFFAGLLMGGLIGSGTMLLLAPRSGKKTRAKIQQEGLELRDQVVETVEDAVAQGRGTARRVSALVRKETKKLQERGQDALDGQMDIAGQVVDSEKTAVRKMSREARRLKRRGKDMGEEQMDVVSDAVDAEKAAVRDLVNA